MPARLGQRIRALRDQLGITSEHLADRAGLHRTYISRVENGRENPPTLKSLAKISAALDWPLHELLLGIEVDS